MVETWTVRVSPDSPRRVESGCLPAAVKHTKSLVLTQSAGRFELGLFGLVPRKWIGRACQVQLLSAACGSRVASYGDERCHVNFHFGRRVRRPPAVVHRATSSPARRCVHRDYSCAR